MDAFVKLTQVKQKKLKPPIVGRGALFDDGVVLNAVSGRLLLRLKALTIGPASRIRSGSVIYAGTRIGRNFETGHHVIVREENEIGDHVSVWSNTTIDYGCVIGDRVKIHCNSYIAQFSVLEDDVFLAPGVILANDLFPGGPHAGKVLQGPLIRRGAAIGVNCTILPGVVIGEKALIGSGSVVTHSIPPHAVAWGNPAVVHKDLSDLKWPNEFPLERKAAAAFYRRRLAGRPVYK
jgi:acetyltransferase-like isoleucine patch superfamily enzyme